MNLRKPLAGLFLASLLLILSVPAMSVLADDEVIMPGEEEQSQPMSDQSTTTPDTPTVASSTEETVTPPTEETSTTSPTIPDWFLHDHPWSRSSTTDASSTPNWLTHLFDFSRWFSTHEASSTVATSSPPLIRRTSLHDHTPSTRPQARERYQGVVKSISSTSFTLSTLGTVRSDALNRSNEQQQSTVSIFYDSSVISTAGIKKGQHITVQTKNQSDGTLSAVSITSLDSLASSTSRFGPPAIRTSGDMLKHIRGRMH